VKKLALLLAITLLLSQIILPANSLSKKIKIKKVSVLAEEQTKSVATNLGLYGGQSSDIAVDPTSNNVYITTMAPNGFFISSDKGDSFHGLPSTVDFGTGKGVEINPTNGDVYASVGDSLIKSTDNGANFTDITSKLGAGAATGEQLLYGNGRLLVSKNAGPGSSSNLAVSTNNGTSFSQATVGGGGQIQSMAASPAANSFYAAVRNGNSEKLYMSNDGGANWQEVTTVPANQRISVIAVDSADANHLVITNTNGGTSNSLQSNDGGSSWGALIDTSQPAETQNVSANYVAFDGERMYIGHAYTTNRGASWGRVNSQTPLSSVYADKFAFDPNNKNILFTNSVYGLAKSTDRGISWADKVTGVASVVTNDISQANNKGVVFIAANGGLAKTTNFTSASPDWQYPLAGTGSASVYSVWVNPANPNVVLYGDHNQIKKSTDGGATWSTVATMGGNPNAPGPGNIQEITSVPGDNNTLYAALSNDDLANTDSGFVFKSTDGGNTWTDINVPSNAPAASLAVAKDGDVYVGASSHDAAAPKGAYKYSGGAWSKLGGGLPDVPVTSILADPENANTVYIATNADTGQGGNPVGSGLYKSTNGGSSWKAVTKGLENVNNLDTLTVQTSTSPNTLYISAQYQGSPQPGPSPNPKSLAEDAESLSGVIYKSSDGGQSWGLFYDGLKQERFSALLFDGLVAGDNRGVYNVKSKAAVGLKSSPKVVKKGKIAKIIITLKDAATKKKLKKRVVVLYKKVIKKKKIKKKWKKVAVWQRVKKAKTNKKGEASIRIRAKSSNVFQARWKPGNKSDKAEYTLSKSKQVRVKVKK